MWVPVAVRRLANCYSVYLTLPYGCAWVQISLAVHISTRNEQSARRDLAARSQFRVQSSAVQSSRWDAVANRAKRSIQQQQQRRHSDARTHSRVDTRRRSRLCVRIYFSWCQRTAHNSWAIIVHVPSCVLDRHKWSSFIRQYAVDKQTRNNAVYKLESKHIRKKEKNQ